MTIFCFVAVSYTHLAVVTAKAIAKAIALAVKAIIAGTKALIAAIAAGGWIAVLVIIVICLIGMLLGSVFGIFFSGEDSGTGMSMQTVVQEINTAVSYTHLDVYKRQVLGRVDDEYRGRRYGGFHQESR